MPFVVTSTSGSEARTSRLAYVLLGGPRPRQLTNILHQLKSHLLPWTPGDVLVFHTGEYDSPSNRTFIESALPSAQLLRIPLSDWTLPAGLREEDAPNWWYAPCCPFPQHGIGYRHMVSTLQPAEWLTALQPGRYDSMEYTADSKARLVGNKWMLVMDTSFLHTVSLVF
jgi:hypothetical protein